MPIWHLTLIITTILPSGIKLSGQSCLIVNHTQTMNSQERDEVTYQNNQYEIFCSALYSNNILLDQILQTIPWNKVDIKVMMIEVEHYGRESRGAKHDLQKYLEGVGFKLYKKLFIDDIYIKHDFELPKSLKP